MAGPSAATAPESGARAATFATLAAAYRRAADAEGEDRRDFVIFGRPVGVRFAGRALLEAVEPALAHLSAQAPGSAQLEVMAWDSASTGVELPERVEDPPELARAGSTIRSSYQPEPRILTLYDRERREAVVWFPDARQVPSNEVASPLRALLHWWARDEGLQFVHGGAVGLRGRAVLIAGPSGAGKSTAALAGLAAGLDYLGDDYVVIDPSSPAVYSLYSAAKLQPEQVSAFPGFTAHLANADRLETEKALWFVGRHFPDQTRASARAVAVLVPQVTGRRESALSPIPRGTALAALAPSTIVQLSGADQWSLTAMARFLEQVRCYRLEAGTDLAGLAAVMRRLLEADGMA